MSCGLCCAGLFKRVRLNPDEVPLARLAGPVVERDEDVFAPLPCAFLQASVCTVYDQRYAACRRFSCKLLRRVADGAVDLRTAATRVATMRTRLDEVNATADEAGAPVDEAGTRRRAKRQLAVTVFNLYADQHFRNVADPEGLSW